MDELLNFKIKGKILSQSEKKWLEEQGYKYCGKCKKALKPKFFNKNKRRCSSCEREWRQENKEKIKEKDKLYRQNNKEKIREGQKNWYYKNHTEVRKKINGYK